MLVPKSLHKLLLDDGHRLRLDVGHVRERVLQVELVALVDDLVLVGLLAVLRVDLPQKHVKVSLGSQLAKRREALVVEEGVVGQVDETLSGAGVWPRGSEGDAPLAVGLLRGIIGDVRATLVHLVDLGGALQSPLDNEVVGIAEEASAVIEIIHDETVETVRPLRSPVAVDDHVKISNVGGELSIPLLGGLKVHLRGGRVREVGGRLAILVQLGHCHRLAILRHWSSSHQLGRTLSAHVDDGDEREGECTSCGNASIKNTTLHLDS
mmetsp:Transcript_57369/g.117446  ORF Transcript_57369/g.117446 Transcript_57369/m.117446 type:complete len:266 (-) Transcript_57369:2-799(-)